MVGAVDAAVVVVSDRANSTRSSLKSFLPIVRVLRTRSMSLTVSVANARSGRSKSPTPRLLRSLLRRAYSARRLLVGPSACSRRTLVLTPSVGRRT
jgi:hypothetical protein